MEPLRLLHFADLHLGVETGGRTNPSSGLNQRVHDVCARLDELCETVADEKVHAVLFAGDAFMNPRPSPTLQKLFAEGVRRLVRSGASVFLLVGNHDLPKMAGIAHPHAIYPALEVEGVVVGERAEVYRLALGPDAPVSHLQVAALPHFSRSEVVARLEADEDPARFIQERVAERVGTLGRSIDPSLPSVFVGHCHVNQADIGSAQTLFGISDVEVPLSTLTSGQPFPYYALGHVHRCQVLQDDPFVAYSGSLERVDYGEGERIDASASAPVSIRDAEAKGFFRFDLVAPNGEWTIASEPRFRPVSARRFVTIRLGPIDASDPATDVQERLRLVRAAGADLTDAFVRVTATIDAADRSRVTNSSLRSLVPESYDVRLALETQESTLVRDPRFAQRMTELDALERFVGSKSDWSDDHDELLRLGRELVAEVLD
ncbi:MAG: metallophosphoesterase family protein [Actinomycetota bacterium]